MAALGTVYLLARYHDRRRIGGVGCMGLRLYQHQRRASYFDSPFAACRSYLAGGVGLP